MHIDNNKLTITTKIECIQRYIAIWHACHPVIIVLRGKNATPASFKGFARTDPLRNLVELSQRGRATLHVVENFVKLLQIVGNYTVA